MYVQIDHLQTLIHMSVYINIYIDSLNKRDTRYYQLFKAMNNRFKIRVLILLGWSSNERKSGLFIQLIFHSRRGII